MSKSDVNTNSRSYWFHKPLLLAILFVTCEVAYSQDGWIIRQLTNSESNSAGSSHLPSINSDGTRIAFTSYADHVGQNPDRNLEIFLYDIDLGMIQITSSVTAYPYLGSTEPSISGDGETIVFSSSADLVGMNPDLRAELFIFNVVSGTLKQITSSEPFSSIDADISANGAAVAFSSRSNLTGENPDGINQIFLFDVVTETLRQISHATQGATSPTVNFDGTLIAFLSSDDLTGENADRNREIFIFDVVSDGTRQVTNTIGGSSCCSSGYPAISDDGERIVFETTRNFTGSNPDGNREMVLFLGETGEFIQATNSTFDNRDVAAPPSLSGNGDFSATSQEADLTSGNPDHSFEIFLFDVRDRSLHQITSSTRDSSNPSLSGSGDAIAFTSEGDFTGENADHSQELFLANRLAPSFLMPPIEGHQRIESTSISSIIDHSSQVFYTLDGVVLAFNGEEGRVEFGQNAPPGGYRKDCSGTQISLVDIIQYDGTAGGDRGTCSGGEFDPDPTHYIDYDGHPGIDFKYSEGVGIVAAASGVFEIPIVDLVNGGSPNPKEKYNTFRVIHNNGFETWYLHARAGSECLPFLQRTCTPGDPARPPPGDSVTVIAGQRIGEVGDTGVPGHPHLHFEVRQSDDQQIVDPFGCAGPVRAVDPEACKGWLWLPLIFSDGFESGSTSTWSATIDGS